MNVLLLDQLAIIFEIIAKTNFISVLSIHYCQYSNSKILLGETVCSLDQTHLECESTLVEIMSSRPRNRVKTKKQK